MNWLLEATGVFEPTERLFILALQKVMPPNVIEAVAVGFDGERIRMFENASENAQSFFRFVECV